MEITGFKPECFFFILGAGASFDSGLPTYRGPEGIYNEDIDPAEILSAAAPLEGIWDFLAPLYQKITESSPGPTYQKMKKLAKMYPDSFILTQNIDGHALTVGLPVVEIHGSWKTMSCIKCKMEVSTDLNKRTCDCGGAFRPDIVLYNEKLPPNKVNELYKLLNRRPSWVVIVGTTLQFPYLRTYIEKAKQRGSRVLHINPDEAYSAKVMPRELWHKAPSEEGLQKILDLVVDSWQA